MQNREVIVRVFIPPPCLFPIEGPPPLIFACIRFNLMRTSKKKSKAMLQILIKFDYEERSFNNCTLFSAFVLTRAR